MERIEMINELLKLVQLQPDKTFDLTGYDIWINNSNNLEGEDFEATELGFDEHSNFGVFVGDDDFFAVCELEDSDIDMIYNAVKN